MVFALSTFVALIIRIWTSNGGKNVADGVISAFILSVTIVVVSEQYSVFLFLSTFHDERY